MDSNSKKGRKKTKERTKSKKKKSKKCSDSGRSSKHAVQSGEITDRSSVTHDLEQNELDSTINADSTIDSQSTEAIETINRPESPYRDRIETYRWTNQLSNSEEECQRIEEYKIERRSRYMTATRQAIAAAKAAGHNATISGFIARFRVSERQLPTVRMPNIYATKSNSTSMLYRNAAGSMSKLSTITC